MAKIYEQRDLSIVEDRARGLTLRQLSIKYGVSASRIRSIIKTHKESLIVESVKADIDIAVVVSDGDTKELLSKLMVELVNNGFVKFYETKKGDKTKVIAEIMAAKK